MDSLLIDASGELGGGQILIGGDYQGQGDVQTARASFVGEDVVIKADALENGDGGEVIVWGNETTRMYGSISATGGMNSGDGGFVETSGGWFDLGAMVPDVSAPNGEGGTWLLDPNNITIVPGTVDANISAGTPFISIDDVAQLSITSLQTALAGGNVIVQTSTAGNNGELGDITWSAGLTLDLSGFGNTRSLTLNAHNDVNFNGSIDIISNPTNEALTLIINADVDNNGSGAFTLANGSVLRLATGPSVGILTVNAGSGITIDGDIDTGTNVGSQVNLTTTGGSISQLNAVDNIITESLVTSSIGGSTTLSGANTVTNFSANAGNSFNITFENRAALTLNGITAAGGNVTINSNNTIGQGSSVAEAIVTGSLDISTSQNVTLSNGANDVDSITASTSTAVGANLFFSFTDSDDLEVQDITVSNSSTSPPDGAFLDIISGGDMSLNGNINTTSPTTGNTGITLNTQNGANIVYQSGTISADTVNFQNDANSTTVGAVGSALNPIQTAAAVTSININHGSNGGSGPGLSGGDLFLVNTCREIYRWLIIFLGIRRPCILKI